MIERARIVTSGKIKIDVSAAKDNINFWNDLHQLELTGFREKANAAVWTIANCVIAVRELETNVTEIHLLVARRHANYQWFYGLQPEEAARECWNRFFRLWPPEVWGTTYQQIPRLIPKISLDIAELAQLQRISEFALSAHIGEIAEERYGKAASQQEASANMDKVRELLVQARSFKREQDGVPDLTPDQLARNFLRMIRTNKPRAKSARDLAAPPVEPPPAVEPTEEDDLLPDLATMREYYSDYSPDTALKILNALPSAWKKYLRGEMGGRWGPTVISEYTTIKSGTVSHYLTAFRRAGIKEWKGIELP